MQQIGQTHVGVCLHGRVKAGRRVLQLKTPLTLGHAQHCRQHAFAHRPGQVGGFRGSRCGVPFVQDTAVTDDQQGVAANAAALGGVAFREGIAVDSLPVDGRDVGLPIR
ncbi:hypothetical protein D3C73_1043820 [compost metagenome]